MNGILLTQDSGFLKPIVWILGKIMEGIFTVIDFIGIPNIGLAIIFFTIVVNLLMMPLTIKQQKFSKLSSKMQPEIQAIQAKYKNRKDQDSQIAMSQEVKTVYAKYGVSQTGGCLYLLIQMPILFSLYRVIYAIPAYVSKIGNTFRVLADKIMEVDGAAFIKESDIEGIARNVSMYGKNIVDTSASSVNGVIDVLNKVSSTDMTTIAQHYDLTNLTYQGQLILSNDTTTGLIDTYNNFLGLNIGNSPQHIISEALSGGIGEAFATGTWLLALGAILIPILSVITQWINVKLMPQQAANPNDNGSSMASSMKTMNLVMPLISAWFCFSWASGMGIYWVAGSIVRSIQQVIVNRHIDKMDFDEIMQKNSAKSAKKLEKMKENQERLNAYANMKTRNIESKVNYNSNMTDEEREKAVEKSTEYYNKGEAKPGSMMAKANMVKQYNEKNNKQ